MPPYYPMYYPGMPPYLYTTLYTRVHSVHPLVTMSDTGYAGPVTCGRGEALGSNLGIVQGMRRIEPSLGP